MLNLLISIMSNTFKRVNKQTIIADSKELANMILEGELFYFWNRKKTDKHYIHICSSSKSNPKLDDKNYRKLKNQISLLEGNQKVILDEIIGLREEMKKNYRPNHESH